MNNLLSKLDTRNPIFYLARSTAIAEGYAIEDLRDDFWMSLLFRVDMGIIFFTRDQRNSPRNIEDDLIRTMTNGLRQHTFTKTM